MVKDAWRDDGERLEAAIRRLDQALGVVEAKIGARLAAGPLKGRDGEEGAYARLAEELEAARARERALEAIAAEASAALGRAAAEVRAALAAEEG